MSSRYNVDRGRRGSPHSKRHKDRSRSRSRSSSSTEESYSKSKSSQNSTSFSRSRDYRGDRHCDDRRSNSSSNGSSDSRRHRYHSDDSSGDDVKLPPPPPPMISKVSVTFGKPGAAASAKPVQMKLAAPKQPETTKKLTVASAFSNNDSDDEVEEMPAECRMRMRNIGRDTPTSSGPNSYGKTKQGFCDAKKIFEKQLRDFHE